ncbi:unnamed protein product, partial [Prunus brigantina]
MKFCHMWKKIHQEFCERAIGSTRTEMTLSSRWKILNKEFVKWRDALAKAMDNHRRGENLSNENCKRFRIIPTGPTVVLNETPLHETPASDSPMDSPMSQYSPIEKEPMLIGRKAAKAKIGSNSTKNASKFLEDISKLQA